MLGLQPELIVCFIISRLIFLLQHLSSEVCVYIIPPSFSLFSPLQQHTSWHVKEARRKRESLLQGEGRAPCQRDNLNEEVSDIWGLLLLFAQGLFCQCVIQSFFSPLEKRPEDKEEEEGHPLNKHRRKLLLHFLCSCFAQIHTHKTGITTTIILKEIEKYSLF